MKNNLLVLTAIVLLASCKSETKQTNITEETVAEIPLREYPENIAAIFKAHGGIDTWNAMNNLCFTLPKGDIEEVHTVDLKSRKTRIETQAYTLGFDGEKVWLKQDSLAFKPERARFYHNLMFYFYAMPFVLGDEGITYSEAPTLSKDGVDYPGTKISFEDGVGDASDDNYIIYRDPSTNQMAWLAYTVTYGKEGPSERYSFIKYDKWQEVNGLQLPSELQWYNVEEGQPTQMRNAMNFTKPTATSTQLDKNLFEKPADGTFAE